MSVLHHMIVMLTADAKSFQSGLSSAGAATKGLQGEVKQAAATNRTLFDSLKTAAVGLSAFAGAGVAVKKFVVDSINETVEYNKQIREMSQFTGLSADETSRLVQVADDWGISIGQLRTSMQMAIKNGFNPTIENLAALADEFVNTADKTAFAEKYSEMFGRQWANIIPLLSKGGDALRDQAAAVDDSLIATEEAIAASREYELALDELGDVITGLKYKLGNELIPVMVEYINTAKETDALTKEASKSVDQYSMRYVKLHSELMANIAAENMSREAIMAAKDEIWLGVEATDALAAATEEASGAEDNYTSVMGLAKDALKEFNVGAADKLELLEKIALATGETTKEELAMKDAVNFLTRMLADGKLTQEEYLALVQQLAMDGSLAAEIVKGLGNAISLLPDSKDIHINVKYHKYGQEDPDAPVVYPEEDLDPGLTPGGQHGLHGIVPPGYNRDNYYVRASSGERIDIWPEGQQGGRVVNNYWNLTINEAGQRGSVVMDFALLQAMARG